MSKKLPFVTSNIPRDLRSFLDRLRELVSSSGADRLLTANDLVDSGLATVDSAGNLTPAAADTYYATPPAPTTVVATAAIRNIIVTWDAPSYSGHAYAEVWGASTNVQASAVLLGMSPGAIYADGVGPSTTRYYWIRFVNQGGVAGAYNALLGTSATTGSDTTYTLGVLAGSITTTELASSLNSRIDLIDGPATTTGTIPNQLALLQGQLDAINAYPDYDNGTTYSADDIVKYNGGLYKALSTTTGNLPTNATYWLKIGDYSSLADIVAAHSVDIATLNTGLSGEVSARETLATQLRGSYTGTDVSAVTTGLVYSERVARVAADSGLASSISAVSATAASKNSIYRQTTAPTSPAVNDVWVDTKPNYAIPYFADDYSTARHNQYQWNGAEWVDITLTDVSDNYALIVTEQTARVTADEAFASSITTLETSVNDPVTGLAATRATLINDYSTTSTVNTAIANSKTTLRAYTDVSASRTFRQVVAPTKRGNDPETAAVIPLQEGDVWIDLANSNKLFQWSGSAWVYSPDGVITGSVSALSATLTNDYLTATDTESAIATSASYLRAYASIQSKVFRQADAPTKRGVDPETSADIPLLNGDTWVDTNDGNKLYQWSGSLWEYSPDATITNSVTTVDARVTTVENTQIGYCTIGGLASDNTTKATCESAGGVWHVGIPMATAVKQVSVSDGGSSATLEQRFTAQKSANDVLLAQYTVKLDVNGYVSGFGLSSTASSSAPTTDFVVNADRFAVAAPMYVGATAPASPFDGQYWRNSSTGVVQRWNAKLSVPAWEVRDYKLPLAVLTTSQTINDVAFDPGVYIDGANITQATVGNAQIADLAVDSAKISSLTVNKLASGSLQTDSFIKSSNFVSGSQGFILNANGTAEFQNAVVRGTVYATDGQFTGEVISLGTGGNKARMWSGNFEVYKDVPAVGVTLYKALSRMETGVGQNNVQVTIPGYFSAQPKIIVSPANIKLYDAAYAGQSQSIQCEAQSIVETAAGSMVWRFTPRATLSLAANTGQTVVNQSSGVITTNWVSSTYTTASNTTQVSPNITLSSYRGTGTSGNYYYRTVRWRVEYLSGGTWIAGNWVTSNLGASAPASTTTGDTFVFPGAGTWQFRIVAEAYDTGGTFNTGTSYEYATDTVSRTDDVTVTSNAQGQLTLDYTPSYTAPSGWTVTSVTYTYHYNYQIAYALAGSARVSGDHIYYTAEAIKTNLVDTFTRSSNSLTFQVYGSTGGGSFSGYASLTLLDVAASITRRRALTNSTTASNSFAFNYFNFNLSASQVLAEGSLNWVAIGE